MRSSVVRVRETILDTLKLLSRSACSHPPPTAAEAAAAGVLFQEKSEKNQEMAKETDRLVLAEAGENPALYRRVVAVYILTSLICLAGRFVKNERSKRDALSVTLRT